FMSIAVDGSTTITWNVACVIAGLRSARRHGGPKHVAARRTDSSRKARRRRFFIPGGEGRPGELTTPLAIPISPGYSKISVEVDVSTPTASRPVSRRNPGGVRQNDFCLNMVRQER